MKQGLRFEFEIIDLSVITTKPISITGVPHRSDFYQILFITKGKSYQTVGFDTIELSAGEMLFVPRNQVIAFDMNSEYEGKIILFTETFFSRTDYHALYLRKLSLFSQFNFKNKAYADAMISSLFSDIEEEYAKPFDEFQSLIIHNMLFTLFLRSERGLVQRKVNPDETLSNQSFPFIDLVEKNFRTMRKVNDYKKLLPTPIKTVSKSLKATLGKTLKEYIDDRVLLEAKRLLVYENMTIKEISFYLGFDEPTKFFKDHTALTPLAFRRENKS